MRLLRCCSEEDSIIDSNWDLPVRVLFLGTFSDVQQIFLNLELQKKMDRSWYFVAVRPLSAPEYASAERRQRE
jgi:hypothetical protein